MRFLSGVFIVLHGLVHLLYFGQSQRFFELQPGMVWPDGSWAFGRLLGDKVTRVLASAACVLAATGFIAGGIGILTRQPWWSLPTMSAATFFTVMLILLWNGRKQKLADQGALGILINLAIVGIILALRRPGR